VPTIGERSTWPSGSALPGLAVPPVEASVGDCIGMAGVAGWAAAGAAIIICGGACIMP